MERYLQTPVGPGAAVLKVVERERNIEIVFVLMKRKPKIVIPSLVLQAIGKCHRGRNNDIF